jgi:DNA-binding MarR family transcriptional regulator
MCSDEISRVPDINKLIHEPARLILIAHLYVIEEADFTYLLNQTGLTWGNLSSHMSKLQEAGYIQVTKSFKENRPQTMLKLTTKGREAFDKYRQALDGVLGDLPTK